MSIPGVFDGSVIPSYIDFHHGAPVALPLLLLVVILVYIYSPMQKGKRLPGPRGLPLIGNLHQLSERSWLTFYQWTKQYGPLVYVNLAGQDAIIIGNRQVAADLLDSRAAIYSDRGRNLVAGQLMTDGLFFTFTQRNDTWKRMRRASNDAMNSQAAKKYHQLQERESISIVDQFLRNPDQFDNHLRKASASLMLSVLYGLPPFRDSNNPDIMRVHEFAERLVTEAAPGAHLAEYFTWMEHLPRWMCAWRRHAEESFRTDSIFFGNLFSGVEERMNNGDQTDSVCSSLIEDKKKSSLTGHEAGWLSASLYVGGAETTSGQMAWFMLSMIIHQDIQKKAQAELDRVVGRDRLPNFNDFEHLPYLRALVKELLRWRVIAPMGVPHRLRQDDYYEGYFLPKDTLCIVNIWGLNRDPDVYGQDAEAFRPERYLDDEGQLKPAIPGTKDESHDSYGFGNRICIGRYVSNNSLFIEIASILWCFNLAPGKDENGNVVIPDKDDSAAHGLVMRPVSFPCEITPRLPEVPSIIAQAMDQYEWQ